MTRELPPEHGPRDRLDDDEDVLDDPDADDVRIDEAAEELGRLPPVALPQEAALRVPRRSIALMAAIGILEGDLIIAYALLIRFAIDALIHNPAAGREMLEVVGGLALVALLAAAMRSVEFSVSERIGYRYVARLRMVMYAHLLRTPPRLLLNQSTGGVLLRFMGDLTTVRTWVSRGVARAIAAACTLLAGLGVVAYLDPYMTLAAGGALLAGAGLSLAEGRNVRRATRGARRQRSNLATNLSDQIGGLSVVQAMGHSRGEYDRLDRQNERLTRHLLRYAGVRATLRAIAGASASLAVVSVLLVGAFDVSSGRTTVGAVVAAMVVVRQLVRPIRTLGLSHEYWQSARVSREKIAAFLRRPYRETDGAELAQLRIGPGRIEFRDVHLAGSLHGVTAEAPAGRIVALLGPNGAGKSSLLSVVARLADPDQGEVRVDGQVLAECTLRSCAARISIMGPQLPLMRGTLRRNLLYRWPDAPQDELERVIRLCRIDDVMAGLPDGLATPIKEGGANLSSGQAGRVALARALVGNPKVLLLDEPTASLDAATRALVHEILLRYGGTVMLATHDVEEAALADEVWRMEAGRVVEVVPGRAFRDRVGTSPEIPAWARASDRP